MSDDPGRAGHHDEPADRPADRPADGPADGRAAQDGPAGPFAAFWTERHLCTLTTLRPDGTPHVVPVGVTYDLRAGVARVITARGSRKARNVAAAGPGGARVAVCQVDGRRWATLEGVAVVKDDPASVAEAERRYAERYRPPRVNPERVVIEIRVDRVLDHT